MVDLLILMLIGGAGVLGWRRGLLVSLLAALAFLLSGLPFAAISAGVGHPAPAVAWLLGGLLGLVPVALRLTDITAWIDDVLRDARLRLVDRAAGAVLNVVVAAAVAWFIAAIASIVPTDSPTLQSMRASTVLGSLVETLPPQGSLGVVVLRSGLVPGVNGPLVLAEEPTLASTTTPGVLAARSRVLEVRSSACQHLVTGTGWVAGSGLVVTNAHVVAGSRRSFLAGGPTFDGAPATVTAFDAVHDVAVLVLDPGAAVLPAPLPIVPQLRHGQPAAVIGFPRGGEQRTIPARIDRVADYDVRPLGGGDPTVTRILAFRAEVQPGNSGGPVLAEDGSVLGLVVAKGLGQRIDAAYGVASADLLSIIAAGSRRMPVSTGRCLDESDLTTDSGRVAPGGEGSSPGVR